MIAHRWALTTVIALVAAPLLAAELAQPMILDGALPAVQAEDSLPSPYSELPFAEGEEQVLDPNQPLEPLIEGYEPVGTPDWARSPYRHSGWRFGLMPTISSDGGDEFALRANLGYEHPDGSGKRAEFFFYDEEMGPKFDRFDFRATTLYLDYYKRLFYHDAELVLGGGVALGHLDFDSARFYGGGGSLVTEGFLPFLSGKRSDLGAVGKGRVGTLLGAWENDTFNTALDDNWALLVEEFSWGLEFRRRYARDDGGYWYINVVREHRLWDGVDLSTSSDLIIQGTAINFGTAW
jgi:hypothetical protein